MRTTFLILLLSGIVVMMNLTSCAKKRQVQTSKTAEINWKTLDEVMALSEKKPKKVIVDIYTDWCGFCRKMDNGTYKNPQLIKYINDNFYAVKFDGESRGKVKFKGREYAYKNFGRKGVHELALAWMQGRTSYPTTVFLDANLNMIQPVPGYMDAQKFDAVLHYFHEDAYKTTPWPKYEDSFKSKIK